MNKKTRFYIFSLIFIFFSIPLMKAQQNVGISENPITPDSSAILELQSTTKGFLITRMTSTERDAIPSPAEALMIFNTTTKCLEIYVNGWNEIWCEGSTPPIPVTCGDTVVDVDGNEYPTVQIGTQCWFTKNLRTTSYDNGNPITRITNDVDWANATSGAYCWAHWDSTTYAHVHGALYNWYTVDAGNLCPNGWHVPSDAEWYTLENYVDATINNPAATGYRGTNASTKLKATTGWMSSGNGTDDYDFAASPGGSKPVTSSWNSPGNAGYWWSSTASGTDAWLRNLVSWDARARRDAQPQKAGFSVRCIKD